jgi:hypothetical protein
MSSRWVRWVARSLSRLRRPARGARREGPAARAAFAPVDRAGGSELSPDGIVQPLLRERSREVPQ